MRGEGERGLNLGHRTKDQNKGLQRGTRTME